MVTRADLDQGPDEPPAASLAGALRTGVLKLFEEIAPLLVANVAWAMLCGAIVYVIGLAPIGLVLLPLVAPLTSGLTRPSVLAARDRVVPMGSFVEGVRHRLGAQLGLGALFGLVLLVSVVNLLLAPSLGGFVGLVSMILSLYVAASTVAYGLVFWTLLADPQRADMPVRRVGRLALAIVLTKPLQVLFLLILTVLCIGVMATFVVPVLFLPAFILLTVAGYVVPAADRIQAEARPRA
jgi:hypothetical protein